MLKKVGLLPSEILMKKFTEISGKNKFEVEMIKEREGIETIADMVEEYLINQQMRSELQH
ncbi:MAG: hypothetical protein WC437_01865 [Patescibacteria group bacterium]|jgi:hypothetical protein|nr:hypothetical protein [Patescibacteria group bacterium]